jgi:hypothetical protein
MEKGMKRKKINLVANMMVTDNDIPYLSETLPALHEMCDRVILMYNGPSMGRWQEIAEFFEGDVGSDLVHGDPAYPPENYAKLRNAMLAHAEVGDWVLKWDPDEIPTGTDNDMQQVNGLKALKKYIEGVVPNSYTTIAIPIYHIVEGNQCLSIEYGWHHVRAFVKTVSTAWRNHIHEQPFIPSEKIWKIPHEMGMGIIHMSYYSPKRLKRKEEHYAKIPGSGHGPGTLQRNIKAGLRELPENMGFDVSDEWLAEIKELG